MIYISIFGRVNWSYDNFVSGVGFFWGGRMLMYLCYCSVYSLTVTFSQRGTENHFFPLLYNICREHLNPWQYKPHAAKLFMQWWYFRKVWCSIPYFCPLRLCFVGSLRSCSSSDCFSKVMPPRKKRRPASGDDLSAKKSRHDRYVAEAMDPNWWHTCWRGTFLPKPSVELLSANIVLVLPDFQSVIISWYLFNVWVHETKTN